MWQKYLPVDGQGFDSLTGIGGACCSGPKYIHSYNVNKLRTFNFLFT